MKRKTLNVMSLCLAMLGLAACSGPKRPVVPGGGNATLSVTVVDTPPAGVSVLSFTVSISGLALNPVSGAAVPLTLPSNPLTIDLTRLQSDSQGLDAFQVAANTYSSLSVAIASSTVTFYNQSGAAIGSCANNTVCTANPISATQVKISSAPFPLALASGQQAGIALDFNLRKALTSTMGVDFTQAGAVTASKLPHTGMPNGTLDVLEDFTGTVKQVSGNSITIQSATRGTLAATASSNTQFNDPQGLCTGGATLACLAVNQTVSADIAITTAGTLSLNELDFIDKTPVDEVEGVVFFPTPPVAGQFSLVMSEKVVASQNAALTGAASGTVFNVNPTSGAAFLVDTKNLPLSTLAGFSGTQSLLNGQEVMVRVSNPVASNGAITVSANRVLLRFSRVTAVVTGGASSTTFSINGPSLPPFFAPPATAVQVQLFSGVTAYDGVTDGSGLQSGNTVSMRALFVNASPAFFAAKVRLQTAP